MCFVSPRASWHHIHKGTDGLLTHTCGQTHPLNPIHPGTLSQALPVPPMDIPHSRRALTCRPHPFLLGPLVTPSHPALPTMASSPFPPCLVSRLLPTHPLATCSAQGRGRSGLALPFAKAAGLWPLAHAGRECRNMPFLNKR